MTNGEVGTTTRRGMGTALLAAIVCVAGIAFFVAQPSTASSVAQLEVVQDAVELKAPGRDAFEEAGSGAPVTEGSVIRTDRTGLAEISYDDGSLTRVGPASTYEIVTLQTEPGRREIVGKLDTGQTFHRVSKVTGSGSRFEVQTSKAVAAVRGTAFAVQCLTRVVCEVGVTEGTVAVITPEGEEVSVTAGRRVTVGADGDLGELRPLSLSDPWIARNAELDEGQTEAPSGTSNGDRDERMALSEPADDSEDENRFAGGSNWTGERSTTSSTAASSTAAPTTTAAASDESTNDTQPRRPTSAAPSQRSNERPTSSAQETTTTTEGTTPTSTTQATTTTTTAAPTTTTTEATTTTTAQPTTTTTSPTTTSTTSTSTSTSTTSTTGSTTSTTSPNGRATTTTTQPSSTTTTTDPTTTSTTEGTTTTTTEPCAEGEERVDGECKPPCPHGRDRQTGNCRADPNQQGNSASSGRTKASGSAETIPFLWIFGFLFGGTVFVRKDPSSWEE